MPRIPPALLRAVSCLNSSTSGSSLLPAASCSAAAAVNSPLLGLSSPAWSGSNSIQTYSMSLQHTQKPWPLSLPSHISRAGLPHALNGVSHRCFSSSATSSSSSGNSQAGTGDSPSSSSSSSSSSAASSEASGSSSLQAAMDKLVDTAVGLVEEGRLQQAVEVLQQGITLLTSTYPGSPELSELHNQAALLLLFGHQHDAAAKHASDALEITQKAFGPTHPLTGHRLLRLGTIRFAAGQLEDARPLLATAADMLAMQLGDPSLAESLYYMNLYNLVAADGPTAVAQATAPLKENFRQLVTTLGPDSMIVRLALAAHSKLVGAMLDMGLQHGEAAFKQHITLQEVQDPESAELGLTLYQLATTYYAHAMLVDAGPVLQRATQLMRNHYPEDHDLMVLCKHRMGMVCAAGRDHRAATALLAATKEHYQKQQQDHPLALEADLGLTMAQLKAMNPRLSRDKRTAAVDEAMESMRRSITGMAGALGSEHLLVSAATRYMAQLSVMLGQRQ